MANPALRQGLKMAQATAPLFLCSGCPGNGVPQFLAAAALTAICARVLWKSFQNASPPGKEEYRAAWLVAKNNENFQPFQKIMRRILAAYDNISTRPKLGELYHELFTELSGNESDLDTLKRRHKMLLDRKLASPRFIELESIAYVATRWKVAKDWHERFTTTGAERDKGFRNLHLNLAVEALRFYAGLGLERSGISKKWDIDNLIREILSLRDDAHPALLVQGQGLLEELDRDLGLLPCHNPALFKYLTQKSYSPSIK